MNKNCFIILSCIDSSYGTVPKEERNRYTSYTIANCVNADKNADVLLVDSSLTDIYNSSYNHDFLRTIFKNLVYYNLGDFDPPLTRQVVQESSDRKITESFALRSFLLEKFQDLQRYKFITVCSNMFICDYDLSKYESGKIYFKRLPGQKFTEDEPEYLNVDTRKYNNDNLIHSYCSYAYSFDSIYLRDFLYLHEHVMHLCRKGYMKITLEQCLYAFTQHLRSNIVEVPWRIDGFDQNGTWYRF